MKRYPKYPPIVDRNPSARKAWRDLWRLLDDAGLKQELYAPMVAFLSVEIGLADEASAAIYQQVTEVDDAGILVTRHRTLAEYMEGRNSQTAPELTVLRNSIKTAARLAAEFGMSPLAQRRLGGSKEKEDESPILAYVRRSNERRQQRKTS